MTNQKQTQPNYWVFSRAELVNELVSKNRQIKNLEQISKEKDEGYRLLRQSIAQTEKSITQVNELEAMVERMFGLLDQKSNIIAHYSSEIDRLRHELNERPQDVIETGFIRFKRHNNPKELIENICRIIEMAVFHSSLVIDEQAKDYFIPILEFRDVLRGDSIYSLS